jgi:hypothetical protein
MPKITTERAWLASTTPGSLLLTLKGKRMPRQRRLIAAGCCRRFYDEMDDPQSRQAVEAAERFADGEITDADRAQAYAEAQQVTLRLLEAPLRVTGPEQAAAWRAWWLAHAAQLCVAPSGMDEALGQLRRRARRLRRDYEQREKVEQCAIIRDVVGNPFGPAPSVNPNWLAWNDRLVPRVAQGIYTERRFTELPVLADALEDAGCGDERLLAHCKSGGTHVRGCWALDLLLHKR